MNQAASGPTLATVLTGTGVGAEAAGGKGEALDRLIGLAVPVPACGLVTAEAYRQFVRAPALQVLLAELMAGPVPDPTEHAAARARVDEAFLSVPLPDHLAAEIVQVATELGGRTLAVRSSATAEDLAGASFAGQYRSFLGVEPHEVADAVRLTWASLWHPAPRVYRRFRSLDEQELAMAVILMVMLDPSESGVLFTTDPGGRDGAMRIEVVSGLGEALVSGAATPEVTVVARDDAAEELAKQSELLAELARIALEIETTMGVPQDIEWAVEDGRLFVLQSRPITTAGALERPVDPLDTVADPDTTYTSAGIAEMVPGLLPPRLWELNSWAIEEGFRRLFDTLGATVTALDRPHALLARFRGRAALDLDVMKAAVRAVPGGSSQELEREYFGRVLDDKSPARSPASGGGAIQAMRLARSRLTVTQEAATMTRASERLADAEPRLDELSDQGLVAYRARLVQAVGRTMAAEIAVAALATAAFRGVEGRLAREVGPEKGATLARRATRHAGADSTVTAFVHELGDRLRASPETAPIADDVDWENAEQRLRQTSAGRALLDDFTDALRRAGSTSVCGGVTWSHSAPSAWQALVVGRTVPEAQSEPDVTLPGGWWLRREAEAATELLARREQAKSAVMRAGGLVWRADRELGRRLETMGRIETVDDVDLLTAAEVRGLLDGEGPTQAEIALRRRRLDEQGLDGALPRVFQGAPTMIRQRPVLAERFTGWGASAGRFEGPARVVRSAAGGGLQRGEVLVAQRTDASWAPLFLIAGAVVIEEGGPLSHASIVSRELGLPAVINAPGIIDRLEREVGKVDLTVDGTTGEVLLHAAEDPDGDHESVPDPTGGSGAGIAPIPLPPGVTDFGRLGVFVSGLIGAGALLSGLMTVSQALSGTRAQARIRARAERSSEVLAEGVVHGFETLTASPVGLRPRAFYGQVAAALALLSLALVAHGVSRPDQARWTPLWRAADLSAAAELLVAAIVLAVAAFRWPQVPPVVRRLAPASGWARPSFSETVGRRGRVVVGLCVGLVGTLALLVHFDASFLARLDGWIYGRIEAGADADRWGPGWIDVLGSSEVMIPVALFVTLAVARCRPLAYAIPTTIALAGICHLGLGWLVERDRPPLGESAGQFDSFPGGFVLEVTLVLGFVPLAMSVLTRRRALWAWPLAAILWFVLVVDAVRLGAHWPSDNLAGLAIGAGFLTVVHGVYRTPALHRRCWDCPTHRRLTSTTAVAGEVLEGQH